MTTLKRTEHKSKAENGVKKKTFCEFFAGIGLVREGLAASGWSCIYANDINAKKEEMYRGRFSGSNHFHLGDIWDTEAVAARIPETPFLATASFPCIDLSLAGHWRGFDGDHSSTFFGFVKLLESLHKEKPAVVMLENVVGFISSKAGKDFQTAALALAELGYWLDSVVVDANYFVPQSRPRIFVIAIREDALPSNVARKVDADWFGSEWGQRVGNGGRLRPPKLQTLMQETELPTGWAAFDLREPRTRSTDIHRMIDLDSQQEWWDQAAVAKHYRMMSDKHRDAVDKMMASGERRVGTIFRRKRHGKTMAEIRFDGVAGCLRTPKGGSARQIVIAIDKGELRMRWMSPREYARLQGAGDFPLVANTIQNLYGFGDAVCVPVISWLDQQILTPTFEAFTKQKKSHRG